MLWNMKEKYDVSNNNVFQPLDYYKEQLNCKTFLYRPQNKYELLSL